MVSAAKVPPGGEGKIEVKVRTSGRKGKVKKSVTVTTNDPKQPRFKLTLSGTVEVLAGFEPSYLRLGRMLEGSTRTQKVKLVGKEISRLKILSVKSSNPERVSARLVNSDSGPELEVTVRAGDKPGPVSAVVTAKTNLEKPRELRLNVSATVTADVAAQPARVYFRAFSKDNPPTSVIRVSSLSGKAFKVTGVRDPSGAVSGTFVKRGNDWTVKLTLQKSTGGKAGKVLIETDLKKTPVVEVTYREATGAARSRSGALPTPAEVRRLKRAFGRSKPLTPPTRSGIRTRKSVSGKKGSP